MAVSNEIQETKDYPKRGEYPEEDYEDLEKQFAELSEKESVAEKKLEKLEEFLFQEKEFMSERNKKKVNVCPNHFK